MHVPKKARRELERPCSPDATTRLNKTKRGAQRRRNSVVESRLENNGRERVREEDEETQHDEGVGTKRTSLERLLNSEAHDLAKIMEAMMREKKSMKRRSASSSFRRGSDVNGARGSEYEREEEEEEEEEEQEQAGSVQLLESMAFINSYLELMDVYDQRCENMLAHCRRECDELRASVAVEMNAVCDGEDDAAGGGAYGGWEEGAGDSIATMNDAQMQEALRVRYREAAERLQRSDQAPSRWRGNLPKEATTMFREWALKNIDNPYPTDDDKTQFAKKTGVPLKQISNWFINYRKRFWAEDRLHSSQQKI
eukprot:CAMPEP_0185847542 /NCGR_PEP_ID=MMETSP1354-20130828/2782_1 /TAXON_ID=708628 /ORGANISM="Erythrolobus madagascarensis, Strain CCMP3276" /LENGTH=310 /DNA_ID=CAMNT_0028547849 /DNA_START=199 /DNA_END=1131 /DNA_ORIENTATION=+